MTVKALIKKVFNWLAYSSKVLVHQGGEHGSMQADVVLELRVLHFDSEATGSPLTVTLSEP